MRTVVSIPDDVFARAERLAEQTKRSRSRLYADALVEYLARYGADAVTAKMNEALSDIDQSADAFLMWASRSVITKATW